MVDNKENKLFEEKKGEANRLMKDNKFQTGIPVSVMKRLPIYHRYLTELSTREVSRISSSELAAKIGVTASQIRQDLSWFGSFGQQGYGYRIDDLLQEITKILGLNHEISMVLVGAGQLGKAIANYHNIRRRGYILQAIFDVDPAIIGKKINGIVVKNSKDLEDFIRIHQIDIGVITVPASEAQSIANIMSQSKIKGIWNFAPVALKVPDPIVVEHVHIGESLMVLSLKIQQKNKIIE